MDGVLSLTLVLSSMGIPLVSAVESTRDSKIIQTAAMVVNNQASQGRTVAWRTEGGDRINTLYCG